MYSDSLQNKRGFTLIEMLVAVALFSIVLLISLGSIMTIVDVNRKSQTLTTVMNDLSFVLENVTRTIKTGQLDESDYSGSGDYETLRVTNQDGATLVYALQDGHITRNGEAITSDQVVIDRLFFRLFWDESNNRQPRVLMVVEGTAEASESISSKFTIQTTGSQRDLETDSFAN